MHSEAYYSEDGGATWSLAAHDGWLWTDRAELAYALADPQIVYCSASSYALGDIPRSRKSRIFVSRDGGRHYSACRAGSAADPALTAPVDYLAGHGDYSNTLWAGDPGNSNLLVVGGVNLYRSTDGGESLTRISLDPGPTKLETLTDFHALAARPDPASGGGQIALYCGCDGGVWLADDIRTVQPVLEGPASWKPRNSGLGTLLFYGAAGNPRTGTIVAGAGHGSSEPPVAARGGWRFLVAGELR